MWEHSHSGRHAGMGGCIAAACQPHIPQHSERRTLNISPLHTSNGGGSLEPPTLATQTGQGTDTGLWCTHELYWGFLPQSSSNPSSHISLGHRGRGSPVCFSLYKTYPHSCSADWHIQQHRRGWTNFSPHVDCRLRVELNIHSNSDSIHKLWFYLFDFFKFTTYIYNFEFCLRLHIFMCASMFWNLCESKAVGVALPYEHAPF